MIRLHCAPATVAVVALFALAWAAPPALAQSAIVPFSQARPGAAPPTGWAPLVFPRIANHTCYALVDDEGTTVVAAAADASASGWTFRLDVPAARARVLRWRWKGERLPAEADTRTRRGDDAVARVYVTFRRPDAQRAWTERLADEAARALYGEAPPHASLMYVWDTRAPVGTRIVNPYTDRVRNIVVESGPARLGRWLDYERDLVADYRAAFGEDAPTIVGVAIMTDADNTAGRASARYGDIALSPR